MATKYFVYIEDEVIGPYDIDCILEFIESHYIEPDTLVFTRKVGEWLHASSYKEFEEALEENFIPPHPTPQQLLTQGTIPQSSSRIASDTRAPNKRLVSNIKRKTNLFGQIIKWFSKGNTDREAFWWDIFYRYEVIIGICIGAIIAFIVSLIIFPLIGINDIQQLNYNKIDEIGKIIFNAFIITLSGVIPSLLLAWLMVSPFYYLFKGEDFSPHKRFDIGPARIGFANILSIGGMIAILYALVRLLLKNIYISNSQGATITIVLTIVLLIVAINAISYGNWRFDWAIAHQKEIYSGHYKYWTSELKFASEREQWRHLRWYKMMVATVLLAGPCILGTSLLFTTNLIQKNNFSHQSNSISKSNNISNKNFANNPSLRNCTDKDYYYGNNYDLFEVSARGGYGAYVRQHPDVNSKILKNYTNGTVFNGIYTDVPYWIRIIDNEGNTIGYIHDKNVSPYIECGEYYDDYNDNDVVSIRPKASINSPIAHSDEKGKEVTKEDINDFSKNEIETTKDVIRQKNHFHFSGYMTDNEGDHPIELDFDASNNGLTNIVYKNVTLGGKIHMKCTKFYYDQNMIWSFTLAGKDGPKDFIMNVGHEDNDTDCYSGTSSVGAKKLTVTLYLTN